MLQEVKECITFCRYSSQEKPKAHCDGVAGWPASPKGTGGR